MSGQVRFGMSENHPSSIMLQGVGGKAVTREGVVGDCGATKWARPLLIKPLGNTLFAEYMFAAEFEGLLEFVMANGTVMFQHCDSVRIQIDWIDT